MHDRRCSGTHANAQRNKVFVFEPRVDLDARPADKRLYSWRLPHPRDSADNEHMHPGLLAVPASAHWAGLFEGRFMAEPLSKHVSVLNMVWLDLTGMAACTLLLSFSLDSANVVWLSAVVVGMCMASALFGRILLMQIYAESIKHISRVSPNAAKVLVPVI